MENCCFQHQYIAKKSIKPWRQTYEIHFFAFIMLHSHSVKAEPCCVRKKKRKPNDVIRISILKHVFFQTIFERNQHFQKKKFIIREFGCKAKSDQGTKDFEEISLLEGNCRKTLIDFVIMIIGVSKCVIAGQRTLSTLISLHGCPTNTWTFKQFSVIKYNETRFVGDNTV